MIDDKDERIVELERKLKDQSRTIEFYDSCSCVICGKHHGTFKLCDACMISYDPKDLHKQLTDEKKTNDDLRDIIDNVAGFLHIYPHTDGDNIDICLGILSGRIKAAPRSN